MSSGESVIALSFRRRYNAPAIIEIITHSLRFVAMAIEYSEYVAFPVALRRAPINSGSRLKAAYPEVMILLALIT